MTYTYKLTAIFSALAMALFGFAAMSGTAAAFGGDDTTVTSSNEAEVTNTLNVSARTGDNVARGARGGHGGDAGDARGRNATGGNGGNGGLGGNGGEISTGDAGAIGTIDNNINTNNVQVEGCGCDNDVPLFRGFFGGSDDTTVTSRNRASVRNNLSVTADTGNNNVSGGEGSGGGEGGDATARSWSHWWNWFYGMGEGQAADGGNGGSGGRGGDGGTIETGESAADGMIVNVINRNIIRVMNDDEEEEVAI